MQAPDLVSMVCSQVRGWWSESESQDECCHGDTVVTSGDTQSDTIKPLTVAVDIHFHFK